MCMWMRTAMSMGGGLVVNWMIFKSYPVAKNNLIILISWNLSSTESHE